MKKLYYESIRKYLTKNIFLFTIVLLLVVLIQYDILKPTLKIGLTPDDWAFIFFYKLLGSNPLSKFAEVWSVNGPYTTVPLYYTGIINSLVGFDFLKMQMVGIFFKILATLVIFPLVLIVFKNRLLAILTTILFAMSYPSAGALETAVQPSEYLGMFGMGLFLITYYYLVKDKFLIWKRIGLATILLIITIAISVMRLYPLLVLIPLIEVYLLIQKPSIVALRTSFLRVFILFLPFILVTLHRPSVILSYIGVVPSVLLKVLEGNWHLALTPLQGMGYTLPFSAHWSLLGLLSIDSFKDYLYFILAGPTIIFGLIILFLSFVTSAKPWRFFLLALCLNLILEILVFFIATHYLTIPIGLRMSFDASRIYSTLFGLFILVLSLVYWIEWKIQGNKDNLLLALWVGPAIAFLFIVLTWMLASENLSFGGAQDHYLLIPELGMSIFIAGLLTLAYKRSKGMAIGAIFITLAVFYVLNRDLIYSYFNHVNANGRAAEGQQFIQSRFREGIKDIDLTKPALFYFDTSQLSGDGPFYTEGLLSILPFYMHFRGNDLVDGCVEVLYANEHAHLLQFIKLKDNERGFFYRSLCVENGKGGYRELFYKPENFYAFKIKDKDFIDIREEILKELGF